MILQLEGEEEETGLGTTLTQLILEGFVFAAPTTRLTSTAVRKEEEEMIIPTKELDSYFFFPSTSLAYSLISNHLEAVHENLSGTFCTNPAMSTQLQKSLLRIAKLDNTSMAPEVKKACQHLAVKLETLVCNYKVYEERKSSSLRSLDRLTDLRA